MTVIVAMTDTSEGRAALEAGKSEASTLDTSLVVFNLSLTDLSEATQSLSEDVTVVDRLGAEDRDLTNAVLDLLSQRPDIERMVIGVKKRSRVGKALLGSVTQQLILQSPIPVLAVKPV